MQQALGTLGQVTETYSGGVASAQVAVNVPQTSYGLSINVQATASLSATTLIGYLAAKIGGPVPAEVAAFLEMALKAT